jgi:thiol-disulfide isomerase/thioredoxin
MEVSMSFRRLAVAGLILMLASGLLFSARLGFTATADEPKTDEKKTEATKKSLPADELVDEAMRAAQKGDLKEATALLEQAVKAEPKNRNALFWLARAYQQGALELERPQSSPLLLKSAQMMRTLRDAYKNDLNEQEKFLLAVALYNEACTYAVEKKKDKAIASLTEATDSGFTRLDLLDEDEELASIRETPEFQKLKKRTEEKALIAAREHAKELLAKNEPFKFDFKLPDLNDKDVALADFKGKVTIVDVWGTWCPPCRKEIPHFVELLKKYKDKGLAIVGINYEQINDKAEAKETIKTFLKENKVPYTCVLGDDKTQEQIPNFEGFPTTLFLDRTGKVRLKVVGYHPMADLDAIVSMLLEEKAE